MKDDIDLKQCMGQRSPGAFQFAPQVWTRCTNKPVAILTVIDVDKPRDKYRTTVCQKCWGEGMESKAQKIINAEPIVEPESRP